MSTSSVTTFPDASSQTIKHAKNHSVTRQPNNGLGAYCWKSWPGLAAESSDHSYPSIYFLGL